MNIGKAIKLCRTQRDMSLATLADRSGLSISYLSLLERDKRDPSLSSVERIASALEIPISILTFLAMDQDEIHEISPSLAEKLSLIALGLIRNSNEAVATGI